MNPGSKYRPTFLKGVMYALRRVSVSFRRITRRIPHFSSASRLLVTTSSSHGHKDGVFGDNDRKFHSSLSLGLSLGLALLCLSTVAQLKENVDDFWENGFVRMNLSPILLPIVMARIVLLHWLLLLLRKYTSEQRSRSIIVKKLVSG